MKKKPTYEQLTKRVQELERKVSEHKKAEMDLRQVVDRIPIPVFVKDIEGRFLFVNRIVAENLGRTIEEVTGQLQRDLHPDKDELESMLKDDCQAIESGELLNISREKYTLADGTSSWWHTIKVPYESPLSEKPALLGVAVDITDLTQTEETIRESEIQFRSVLETLPLIAVSLNSKGNITFCNDWLLQLTGWDREEVLGKNWFTTFLPKETRNKIRQSVFLETIRAGNFPVHYQNEIITKNGERRLINWNNTVFRNDEGDVIGGTSIGEDITDRQKAEIALKDSEERFKTLSDASFESIFLSVKGVCIGQNITAEKMFGYSHAEAVGKQGVQWISPEDREQVKVKMLSENAKPYEVTALRKDGTTFPCEIQARTLDYQGKMVRVTAVRDITERKRMEKALVESEASYRLLIENQTDMVVKFDTGGRLLFTSPSYCKTFDKIATELYGKKFIPFIHEEDREAVAEALDKVYKPPYRSYVEERALTKDGWRWQAWLNTAVLNKEGKVESVVAVGRDITERKEAEEALRDSEERWQGIIKNAAIGIYQVTEKGRFQLVNPTLARIFGYSSPDDFLTNVKNISQLYLHTEDRAPILNEMNKKGYVDGAEAPFRHRDGKTIWIRINARVIRGIPGKMVYEGLMADITARKQAENALRESEDQYRNLIELNPEGIYVCREGKIIYANQATLDILGANNKKELIGRTIFNLIHPDDREKAKKRSQMVIETWESVPQMEFIFLRLDGGTTHAQAIATPVVFEKEPAVLSVVRDVTNLKKVEAEKNRLELQLHQAQKLESIGNLAGGIAHDFNNILASILGFTELALEDAKKGSNLEDNLQEVFIAGKRARDLVKQILAFARQSDEEVKPIQVDSIIKETLKLLRSSIPTTIEIKEIIESGSLIMGNAIQVEQIVMNLCTNAAYAMENEGGILEVSLKDLIIDKNEKWKDLGIKPGDFIELKISDTGSGISPESIDSIFEPYFTTKGPGEGTGMGLALVHGIVEGYNGKITVDSQAGKGTIFTIYLPVTKKRGIHRPYQSEELPTGKECILLVDDEAPIANMGGQILTGLGYSVTTRTSSIEALELFQSKPGHFDLVVTDMTMPNMTGDILAAELMAIRPDIPVILCTGYSKKISDKSAADIGIKAFAYKPLVKAELAKTVRKVLDEAKGIPDILTRQKS